MRQPTELLYLKNGNLLSCKATIVAIESYEDATALILDQTIFYAQGGGQPADQGTIHSDQGTFLVEDVRKSNHGILHIGKFSNGTLTDGEAVTLSVDAVRRKNHTRLHSAGHLIDAAIYSLGLTQLIPTKGFHFPEGPYDEFDGVVEQSDLKEKIEKACKLFIQEERPVSIREIPVQDVKKECGYVPSYIPQEGVVRVIQIYGFPAIPCGGTHVSNTKEIRDITIRKARSRGGKTRVAHTIPLD